MTLDHPLDNPLSTEDAEALLREHGPAYASRFTDTAVKYAMHLIRAQAFALEQVGMTRAANDLFTACAHLEPVPTIVSQAQSMDLNTQLQIQRSGINGMLAVAFSRSSDSENQQLARDIADRVAKSGVLTEYTPMERV